jgi:hypothetical protein
MAAGDVLPVATDPRRHILIVSGAPLLRLEISRVWRGDDVKV